MVKIIGKKSNLSKYFKQEKVTTGELAFPLFPVVVPLAFDMDVEYDAEMDSVDEDAIEETFEAEVASVMGRLANELSRALTEALKSPVWAWNGGARDIYNTGELARSLSIVTSGKGLTISYGAPYASIIHNGGYIFPYGNKNARPVYLPPRPWIQAVLYGGGPVPQYDVDAFLEENLR